MVFIHKIKELSKLNKPAYVGMCILDLSSTLVYDSCCNYIKDRYGKKARLLFTDTDSLLYEIEVSNVYEDFYGNKDMFDEYPDNVKFYDATNKNLIGKMKHELIWIH